MPMPSEDLQELLETAMTGNATRGITGALVYGEGTFLQILEGDKAAVLDLMARIRRDMRHEAVTILREGEIPGPVFGGWKMAYVSASAQQVAKWAGLGVASDTPESLDSIGSEKHRTDQFAQDILALLVCDKTGQSQPSR
jgi:hypothetical protein